jgi:hypothetical protein
MYSCPNRRGALWSSPLAAPLQLPCLIQESREYRTLSYELTLDNCYAVHMHALSPPSESLCVELIELSSLALVKDSGTVPSSHTSDNLQGTILRRLRAAQG